MQVAKVLRQVFGAHEPVATEDAIDAIGKLHTTDQLRVGVALLYGHEYGRMMAEMLPVIREAQERHAEGQHPALDVEEFEAVLEAFSIIPACSSTPL